MEKIERMLITPEVATKILEKNTGNRAISASNLAFLVRQMNEGEWKYAADPIRIAENGKVLDGQHRLTAIIKAGVSLEMLVISGLDESIFTVIDTGKPRSASDVLSIASYKNATLRAAIARMILSYSSGRQSIIRSRDSGNIIGGGGRNLISASNTDILRFVQQTDLDNEIDIAQKCYGSFKMLSKSEYGFFYHIFSKLSTDAAYDFLIKLSTGVGLTEGDSILLLRSKLISESTSSIKVSSKIKLILIIKSWNHYRAGTRLKILQYTTQQDVPEPI